jgi:transcription elongation factor GreA
MRPISKDGMSKILLELKDLKEVQRPEIMTAIQIARGHGDLSENAEYSSAKEHQRHIDRRIRELEVLIKESQVIDIRDLSGDIVKFGATVELEDEDGKKVSYKILSEFESDVANGIISVVSPIGHALIGKKVGDFARINIRGGVKEYEILSVKFIS